MDTVWLGRAGIYELQVVKSPLGNTTGTIHTPSMRVALTFEDAEVPWVAERMVGLLHAQLLGAEAKGLVGLTQRLGEIMDQRTIHSTPRSQSIGRPISVGSPFDSAQGEPRSTSMPAVPAEIPGTNEVYRGVRSQRYDTRVQRYMKWDLPWATMKLWEEHEVAIPDGMSLKDAQRRVTALKYTREEFKSGERRWSVLEREGKLILRRIQ